MRVGEVGLVELQLAGLLVHFLDERVLARHPVAFHLAEEVGDGVGCVVPRRKHHPEQEIVQSQDVPAFQLGRCPLN